VARVLQAATAIAVPPAASGRTRRGGEVHLRIVPVLVFHPEQATATQVAVEPPHGAQQDFADLARLQVTEPLPDQTIVLLVPGAVEEDGVQVGVETQVG
jgi:hypothetical protein